MTGILTGNSNQICTPPPRNGGAGEAGGIPHKLYNKKIHFGQPLMTDELRYKQFVEDYNKSVPQIKLHNKF